MSDESYRVIDNPFDRPTLSHLLTAFPNMDTGELEDTYDELMNKYVPESAFIEAYSAFYREDVDTLIQFFYKFGVPENQKIFEEEIRENLPKLKSAIRPFSLYEKNSKPFEPYLLLGKRDIDWNDWQFCYGGYVLPEEVKEAFGDCSWESIQKAKTKMADELAAYGKHLDGDWFCVIQNGKERIMNKEELDCFVRSQPSASVSRDKHAVDYR